MPPRSVPVLGSTATGTPYRTPVSTRTSSTESISDGATRCPAGSPRPMRSPMEMPHPTKASITHKATAAPADPYRERTAARPDAHGRMRTKTATTDNASSSGRSIVPSSIHVRFGVLNGDPLPLRSLQTFARATRHGSVPSRCWRPTSIKIRATSHNSGGGLRYDPTGVVRDPLISMTPSIPPARQAHLMAERSPANRSRRSAAA